MAQLERTAQGSLETPKTPRAQTSAPTIEQILKGDRSFHEDPRSASTSPTSRINHDKEEPAALYSPTSKKSVLTKVKERAKKLKNSLSGKKRFDTNYYDPNNDISSSTHSWDTNLHDNDDEEYEHGEAEVDPEYLGAPMYESEAAPENLKETARQHPRADPVVSEKHMCPRMSEIPVSPNNKTITESVSEKLAAVSDATHSIASKFAGLAVSTTPQQPAHISIETVNHLDRYGESKRSSPIITQCNPHQKWDKGVSVREYFMNKLEPGEDEKALSQAITEAMSPRKISNINNNNNNNNEEAAGMVEKVKEAVTSLFRLDEPVSKSVNSSSVNAVPSSALGSTLQNNRAALGNAYPSNAVYGARASSSRHVPVSTHEVAEEENHGRILQAN